MTVTIIDVSVWQLPISYISFGSVLQAFPFTDAVSPLLLPAVVDKRWNETAPLFCLSNFHIDGEVEYRCKIPILKTQC